MPQTSTAIVKDLYQRWGAEFAKRLPVHRRTRRRGLGGGHQPLRRHARARPPDRRVPLLDHARRGRRGQRLFEDVDTSGVHLKLTDERRLENGSVILTYAPG